MLPAADSHSSQDTQTHPAVVAKTLADRHGAKWTLGAYMLCSASEGLL